MKLLAILKEREDQKEALRLQALAEVRHLEMLLRTRFEFDSLHIVGSLSSGGFGRHSDVDLVIKGLKARDFFKVYALLMRESSFRIDLKPYEDLNGTFQSVVQKEGIKVE